MAGNKHHSAVQPNTWIAIRMPSGLHKVLKIVPDTTISLGKFGTFNTNALLGRPYYHTYELTESEGNKSVSSLRIVPASELHAETAAFEDEPTPAESRDEAAGGAAESAPGFDIVSDTGEVLVRNNRLTIDDANRQTLTMAEIEELKKADTGSGKEIVERILKSHSALDEKTTYSLAKYTARKNRKYFKRFTALPLNVSLLTKWMVEEKEPARVMELREESLGLIASWSNIHYGGLDPGLEHLAPSGRWLVVDDTGGLLVAALAERMGILYPPEPEADEEDEDEEPINLEENSAYGADSAPGPNLPSQQVGSSDQLAPTQEQQPVSEQQIPSEQSTSEQPPSSNLPPSSSSKPTQLRKKSRKYPADAMTATNNTLTILHAAAQPNISMLSYFAYDPGDTSATGATTARAHPLHTHLKTINFLQLVNPSLDASYAEPDLATDAAIAKMKSSHRGNYYRKRRRWAQTKRVVDEVRAGGYDGLVVASAMAPASIFNAALPLLKGGAHVVVYSAALEPLTELADYYSSSRKAAFLAGLASDDAGAIRPTEDFPVDPRLLLAPTLQTARAREWQVLPGRTHPVMTSRGGAEGYLFTARRVLPAEGRVEARGRFSKKRKAGDGAAGGGGAGRKVKVEERAGREEGDGVDMDVEVQMKDAE